ncbi:hypothetical protein [Edaphobacter aggregans]|uniref:hypothetical protein n=1 Tax=Edaphobacter aggregans TaxID=570835 RepID=UPI00054D01DA|nr:hypothetical protein [Edaphobacter aggregans]
MPRTRSILIHGLGIALRRFPAFLWTYAFNLVLALAFCLPLKVQLSNLLDHSLAAQRLSSGFDLGTMATAAMRLHEGSPGQASSITSHASVPLYLLLYFLLVPGTLHCYLTRSHTRLSTLIRQGLLHFWRFVRITLLTLLAAFFLLGPLAVLQQRWARFVDDRFVGSTALILTFAGLLVVLLAATLLRLYFDLVEAYTVQLGTHLRPSGKPDRRVRRTLAPAFRLLRNHLARAWLVFLLLAALGAIAAFLSGRTAMHMLAQPRVWPLFLVAQLGLFLMLFTRFWQRGAETALILQHPILSEEASPMKQEIPRQEIPPSAPPVTQQTVAPPAPSGPQTPVRDPLDRPRHIEMIYNPDPLTPLYPAPLSPDDTFASLSSPEPKLPPAPPPPSPDPIPNPEPAAPSLDEPDPGVFHHDPQKPAPQKPDPPKP